MTESSNGDALRLDRLERELRQTRNALAIFALAALAGFVTLVVWIESHGRDRARFAAIEARQILVDPGNGQPRIRLGTDENGVTRIVIGSDRRNENGIGFGLPVGAGPQLFINDPGSAHLNLGAGALAFMDSAYDARTVMTGSQLVLTDTTGAIQLKPSGSTRINRRPNVP